MGGRSQEYGHRHHYNTGKQQVSERASAPLLATCTRIGIRFHHVLTSRMSSISRALKRCSKMFEVFPTATKGK